MNDELKVPGFQPVYKAVPPFMKFEGGFGYQGVLLEDEETGKLQCHLCGHLALNLSKHLFHKHKKISPAKYRGITGLNRTTPLVAPSTQKKIKNNFLDLTEEKKKQVIALLKANNARVHKEGLYKKKTSKGVTQQHNKYGTCPEQCKERFYREYKKLGHIPSGKELSGGLRHIIYSRFGSYKKALLAWGITEQQYREYVTEGHVRAYEARAEHNFFPKYSDDEVKQAYQEFYFQYKRLPTWGEVEQHGLPGRIPFTRVFGVNKSQLENRFKVKEFQIT